MTLETLNARLIKIYVNGIKISRVKLNSLKYIYAFNLMKCEDGTELNAYHIQLFVFQSCNHH
jgi:hypothetical protein